MNPRASPGPKFRCRAAGYSTLRHFRVGIVRLLFFASPLAIENQVSRIKFDLYLNTFDLFNIIFNQFTNNTLNLFNITIVRLYVTP